jgi:murein DD-endopeptidase MepM/ murein hydrolase activator NlpD
MEGKGSGNSTADKLDILAVQDEINTKRIAYKKENLYNMLNELSNVGDGSFGWPLDGGEISSFYGYRVDPFGSGGGDFHPGLDIAQSYGEPVKAANAGTVEMAGWNGGYGRYIRIDHGNGLETAYGHMSALVVEPGQKVSKGQVIGFVGSSGASTGPHLHFEVLKSGNTDNPLSYVNPR